MQDETTLEDALDLMRDLRRRCEWDAAQSHDSLRPYLIEEAHELEDAIRSGDDAHTLEELGDVLLQVLFHSVIAEERGAFTAHDVPRALIAKMRARHPHLYEGGEKVPWEKMKAKRRQSISEGLPASLPALHRAHRLQDRAAGVGFDWPDVAGPIAKVAEELEEVRDEIARGPVRLGPGGAPILDDRHAAIESELGDLLFACVNLCRKAGVHASLALDRANTKFAGRFTRMEETAAARGLDVRSAGLEALDAIWDEVKAHEVDGASAQQVQEPDMKDMKKA